MIRVNNLTKFYGKNKALDGVSFELKAGEIVGFLGPNGAGKTTTMKIITGYVPPTSGEVFVSDIDVLKDPMRAKREVGYLPENNPLYMNFTTAEMLATTADIYGFRGSLKQDAIARVVEQCSLSEVYYRPIDQLSKGYRQRVGLASALISDPSTLILDEPTVGLDPNQIQEIRALIKNLGKKRTILLSTHIMSEAQATTDRIIIINNGQIIREGKSSTLQNELESSKQVLEVLAKATLTEVKKSLTKVKSVTSVTKGRSEGKFIYRFRISLSGKKDMRKSILADLMKSKIEVYEFTQKHQSLEDFFRAVTNESGE